MRKSGKITTLCLIALLSVALLMAACGGGKVPTASVTLVDTSFTFADGTYTATVDADVTTLDVLNYFEVNDGFTLKLYSDAACTTEVDGDPTLEYGENVFYLRAEPTGKGTAVTYTVKIMREAYVIIFMDGTTEVGRLYVGVGGTIGEAQLPKLTKSGYTLSWDGLDLSVAPTASATYHAVWTANLDTPYKVEHYLQNAARDGYDLHETENLTGETDTTATAVPKLTGDYATYEHNAAAAGSLLSGNIAGDGSLVLKVYYDKASAYTILFMDGTTEVGRATVEVGEKVNEDDIPTPSPKAGYTFEGWEGFDKDEAPTGNATYYAKWTPNADTAYKVEHYLQKTDLSGYELHDTENLTGTTDTTATATPKTGGDYEGYVHNAAADGSLLSAPIAGEGTLVLKVYYDCITYDIAFDFDYTTDIDDGARYEGITSATAVVLYNGQITFTVFVNEDYNQSTVQYTFTPADGSPVTIDGQFNGDDKSYTYTYAPTESGTIRMVGTYQENKYQGEVNLNLTLLNSEWSTIASLDEVQILVGNDTYAYTDAVEGKLLLSLKHGTYTVTIKDGERTTDFTLAVNPADWDAKLAATVYSVDITMTVGYSRVEVEKGNIDQNLDGTLGAVTAGNNAIRILDGDTSGDFAVNMRFTITNMAVDWSALDVRIGTLQIFLSDVDVLINANGTKIGAGLDSKTKFTSAMSNALLLRTGNNAAIAEKPFIVDYTIVRLYDDQIRMYFGVVDNDRPENETWYYVGNLTRTALNIVGSPSASIPAAGATVIDAVLKSTQPLLAFTQNNNFTLTYSHYGVSTSFFYSELLSLQSGENGSLTADKEDSVKAGETVVVTATPEEGMAVASFTVKKNGGEPVAVESADFGTVNGEFDAARTFTFVAENVKDTYEFAATFEASEYVAVSFTATYPEWYKEADDVLTVKADGETAVATANGDGTFTARLKRGSYSSVTVSSARFRVSAADENKALGSVDVTGDMTLTSDTVAFTLIKLTASGTNSATYPSAGSIRIPNGGSNYYTFAGVEATEGFTFKYSMKAESAEKWTNGGFFFRVGTEYYTLMVYSSQGKAGGARLQITQNTGAVNKNAAGVITKKTVGALNTEGINVEIAYYSGAFYVRINGDYAVRFGAEMLSASRHCKSNACELYMSDAEFAKTGNTDGYGIVTPATYFAANNRALGLRAMESACVFTGVEYALGNTAAKALVDDMRQHAKNDDASHGTAWVD